MGNVKFGSARISETGGINGAKGDQKNGAEVSIQDYYMSSKGWICFRPISPKDAQALSQSMTDACNNNFLGYGQNDREDVCKLVKSGIKLKNINTPSNCDCSSLVRACVYEAMGIDVGNFNTATEGAALLRSGKFIIEAIQGEHDCKTGDILVTKTKGHTVIVVAGYENKKEPDRSIEIIAKMVIAGKFGNGDERKRKIEEAGYNYADVQKVVNQLIKG